MRKKIEEKRKKNEKEREQRKEISEEERRREKQRREENKQEEKGTREAGKKEGRARGLFKPLHGVRDNNITRSNYCDNGHVLDYFPAAIAPQRCTYDRK